MSPLTIAPSLLKMTPGTDNRPGASGSQARWRRPVPATPLVVSLGSSGSPSPIPRASRWCSTKPDGTTAPLAADRPDDAQEAELDLIARKLRLAEGTCLLDIGAVWGSLILFMPERLAGTTAASSVVVRASVPPPLEQASSR